MTSEPEARFVRALMHLWAGLPITRYPGQLAQITADLSDTADFLASMGFFPTSTHHLDPKRNYADLYRMGEPR